MRAAELESYPMLATVHAVEALDAATRGDLSLARKALARASTLGDVVAAALPRGQIHLRLILAEVSLVLRDTARVGTDLAEAKRLLPRLPDAVQLQSWADEIGERLDEARSHEGPRPPITRAEMRVLELLQTHQTLEEIGETLFISRNTVKSHTISIYRKLGVSGRSAAVELAVKEGLTST
jgi:LuxR family maltose regulon positive regulatory protein